MPATTTPAVTRRATSDPGSGWRDRAACAADDVDPESFFPASDEGPVYDAQVAAAKTVCARCTVRDECLEEALARIPFGIAGGLTPEERRRRHRPATYIAADRVLERGLRPGAARAEVTAAGLVLLTAGRPIREIAARCGVVPDTVRRWHSRHHAAEGSAGGNRAPLLTSPTHDAPARTPTPRGPDPR